MAMDPIRKEDDLLLVASKRFERFLGIFVRNELVLPSADYQNRGFDVLAKIFDGIFLDVDSIPPLHDAPEDWHAGPRKLMVLLHVGSKHPIEGKIKAIRGDALHIRREISPSRGQ